MSLRITLAAAAALTLGLLTAASAHDYKVGDIAIAHPWSRATPPNAPVAGGYMTLSNEGSSEDRLIGGSSSVAGEVQIHEMTMDGSIMKMRQLESGLAVPGGETVTLQPGGYHIMLIQLTQPLKEGQRFPLMLHFKEAGHASVEIAVKAIDATAASHQ